MKEEEILKFWQEKKIFEKSEAQEGTPFSFYDGPPFASGLPHYGHLLASAIKDAIPRYHTMRGRQVRRRFGWDCHGLPVENIVEAELGLKVKKDIEEYGIEKFNARARETVLRFTDDWKKIIPRFGRFVDMDNDYRTMDLSYTESVWWVFKSLHEKGLIYEGYKIMHLCPRCETTLANFEVNQGYKDITDISVTVEFELVDTPKTFLLAWTTTPWTLPGNVALAVNPNIEYVEVTGSEVGNTYIIAKSRVEAIFKEGHHVQREFKGSDLVGKKYRPVFDYYSSDAALKNVERGWQVYAGDFVTTEEGTGIVHIAPAFGEDDYALAQKENLPFVQHVATNGAFKPEVKDFAGELVKPKDDHQRSDILVLKYLAEKNVLFAKEKITHSYPHCWRCDTPLLNYAASSWFVKVTSFKDELIRANNGVSWVPAHIKEGRFGKWLLGARDWAISRSRFWGAPIPVWKCKECGESKVIGSMSELKALVGTRNNYFSLRHGEAESNVSGVVSADPQGPDHLTERGKSQVQEIVAKLKEKNIDLIIASDFVRTRETAELVREGLGLSIDSLQFDERLRELDAMRSNGKTWKEHFAAYGSRANRYRAHVGEEENYSDVATRMMRVLYEVDEKYEGKNILIISHAFPLFVMRMFTHDLSINEQVKEWEEGNCLDNGQMEEIHFAAIPHNDQYLSDVHRPHIDLVETTCACGGTMQRVPEVFDCWFESGAMPYGQAHYLGHAKKDFDPEKGVGFPAEFIAEGLDQTRGWFYSLMVLSVGLFNKAPYQNVVVNGLILAEDGQKMSKKLKNYPDPSDIIERYGADALRYYLLSSPVVRAEDLNFSERGVAEVYRKNVARLQNVLTFYSTFAHSKSDGTKRSSTHVLDRWIRSRTNELIAQTSAGYESYELDRAVKPLAEFIDDLSTWYLRRSRERLKKDGDDSLSAAYTLRETLRMLSLVLAPAMPFIAEDMYQAVRTDTDKESVHLASWPEVVESDAELLTTMARTRAYVSEALEKRAQASIKVRQPLPLLTIPAVLNEEFLPLIKDEVNVKVIKVGEALTLDTTLTPELISEGQIRDVVRALQDARKTAFCDPKAQVAATITTSDGALRTLIEHSRSFIQRDALVHTLIVQEGDTGELSVKITP